MLESLDMHLLQVILDLLMLSTMVVRGVVLDIILELYLVLELLIKDILVDQEVIIHLDMVEEAVVVPVVLVLIKDLLLNVLVGLEVLG